MRRIATVEMGIVKYFMDTCSRSVKSLAREYEGGLERRRKTQTETKRQTDRQTDRQTSRQTDRQTDRQTEKLNKAGRRNKRTNNNNKNNCNFQRPLTAVDALDLQVSSFLRLVLQNLASSSCRR